MLKKQPRYGENNVTMCNGNDQSYVSFHITDSDGDTIVNMAALSGNYTPPATCTDGFLLVCVTAGNIVVTLTGSADDHPFTILAAWMKPGDILNFRCMSVIKTGTAGTFKVVW